MTALERDLLLTLASLLAGLCDDAGHQLDAQDIRDGAAAVLAAAMRNTKPSENAP